MVSRQPLHFWPNGILTFSLYLCRDGEKRENVFSRKLEKTGEKVEKINPNLTGFLFSRFSLEKTRFKVFSFLFPQSRCSFLS